MGSTGDEVEVVPAVLRGQCGADIAQGDKLAHQLHGDLTGERVVLAVIFIGDRDDFSLHELAGVSLE
jgi:hypothetical protein